MAHNIGDLLRIRFGMEGLNKGNHVDDQEVMLILMLLLLYSYSKTMFNLAREPT